MVGCKAGAIHNHLPEGITKLLTTNPVIQFCITRCFATMNSQIPDTNNDDLLWLAGWWEGEGCFTSSCGRYARMHGTSTDKDVIERVASILGTTVSENTSPSRRNTNRKTIYRTSLSGTLCKSWMIKLFPLMGNRRKEKIIELFKQAGIETNLSL